MAWNCTTLIFYGLPNVILSADICRKYVDFGIKSSMRKPMTQISEEMETDRKIFCAGQATNHSNIMNLEYG